MPAAPINPFPERILPDLERPPIELIIGQVRVPLVVPLLEPGGIAAFQRLARSEYPHLAREEQIAIRLGAGEGPRSETAGLWRLEDAAHDWTLTVAPDFVALEAKSYRNFAEFRDRLVRAAEWFKVAYDIPLRVRIGLRYVDRFDRVKYPQLPTNWMQSANPALLPPREFAAADEHRAFTEHRVALGVGWAMTVRITARTTRLNVDVTDELLFDMDAYSSHEGDFATVSETLDWLKKLDYAAFGWASASLLDLLPKKS